MDDEASNQLLTSLVTSGESATATHEFRKATGRRPWLPLILQWYLLFLYLIYTLISTMGMIFWLGSKSFSVSSKFDHDGF